MTRLDAGLVDRSKRTPIASECLATRTSLSWPNPGLWPAEKPLLRLLVVSFRPALTACLVALTACSASPAPTTTTEVLAESAEPTTTEVPTTALMESTTTTATRVELEDFGLTLGGGGSQRVLRGGTTYVIHLEGLSLELTPTDSTWRALGVSNSRAIFGWSGRGGHGALEVLVYDIGFEGVEAAWTRIEGLRESLYRDDLDWEWTWVDQGVGRVGDIEAEWREIRIPPVPEGDPDPNDWNALPVVNTPFEVVLGHDSSARFYVVPVGDATVTVLAWESRCMCPEDGLFRRESFVDDDFENELSMWTADLEAFLDSLQLIPN